MARLGVIDYITLGSTLVFAIPIGLFGGQLLLDGQILLGLTGVGVAVSLLLVERFLWTPEDIPIDVGKSLVKRVVGESAEENDR